MAKMIKNIVIVGGGTAGWMSAAALSTLLKRAGVKITLIESEQIPTVGVGEATIPQISLFNRLLEISEDDFIRKTSATFKLGIEFKDWGRKGESYIHPFGDFGVDMEGVRFHHFWRRGLDLGVNRPLGDYTLQSYGAERGKFTRPQNIARSPLSKIAYAFQFDAGLYAKYLRELSEARGTARIEGKVTKVNRRSDDGFIESLTLDSGQVVSGDLFIDCSGFRGLLIEDALKAGYTDWSHWLPVNRAVAVACESPEDPIPYTRATARDAGWQWRIPLQHRLGNGYVYSDKFLAPEQAEDDLLESLEGEPLASPKHLKFTTGHRKKFWDKNCVALGLSAGFMEPLESTSIHLVQAGLGRLMALFPDMNFAQSNIDHFNRKTLEEYIQVRDFLILHYKVTNREDTPFWRYVRNMDVPDKVLEKIAAFDEMGRVYREDNELFNETSWLAVMQGQGMTPKGYHPIANVLSDDELKSRLDQIYATVVNSEKVMPTHQAFINEHCRADIDAITADLIKKRSEQESAALSEGGTRKVPVG